MYTLLTQFTNTLLRIMSMIINDKRQRYYGEIKARFYLR